MARIVVENVNHPGSTRTVDARMYHAMKRAWLRVLPVAPPGLTGSEIRERVSTHLPASLFPDGAKVGWWSKTVQLDLEAKGLISRRKARRLRWHRANKNVARAARQKPHGSAKSIRPTGIDEYIATCPAEVQAVLRKVRSIIARGAPDATEKISYGIPAFALNGMLIYFAAFKRHIGLYPPVKGGPALNRLIARYRGEKGNLRIPLDEPIPYDLIARIVEARLAEHTQTAGKRVASSGSS